MDDKTFMAKYVAEETQRLNKRMKDVVEGGRPLTEEEQAELTKDMTESMNRLKQTLMQIQAIVDAENAEEESTEEA